MSAGLSAWLLPLLLLLLGVIFSEGQAPKFSDQELTEIFGDVCGVPLNDDLKDDQYTASSSFQSRPSSARFNQGRGGWKPRTSAVGEWIQIRLPSTIYVTAILTQGGFNHRSFVTEYKVEYGLPNQMSCVLDMHGQPKIFEGNVDTSTPKINDLRPAVFTRYIRILPLKWHNGIALRLEIFGGGCKECWQK